MTAFRMGTPYGYLPQELATVDPEIEPGHSGYFSNPSTTLDPHLFSGDRILDNVRKFCIDTLLHHLGRRYKGAARWTTVWLAGSGISYQWAGDRGNGDLDVLFGIDWPSFYGANPDYKGLDEDEMVQIINTELKENLWPTTANQNLNGQVYEITFYVNPGASDIRNINPYAAYNLTDNSWTVRPSNSKPQHFPKSFFDAAEQEAATARQIVSQYKQHREIKDINDLAVAAQIVAQAKTL